MTYIGYYNCVNAYWRLHPKIEVAIAGKVSVPLSLSQFPSSPHERN